MSEVMQIPDPVEPEIAEPEKKKAPPRRRAPPRKPAVV